MINGNKNEMASKIIAPKEVTTTLLRTIRIKEISALDPYLKAWQELSAGIPMCSSQWLLSWWSFYAGSDDELYILLIFDPGNVLVGIAPLYIQNKSTNATLRLLGSGGDFTHHTNWLSAMGCQDRIGTAVALFLLNSRSEWKELLFEGVDEEATSTHLTINDLSANGFLCHRRQIQSCWKISLPATWDDYLKMLSRSLRKRCRQIQREDFDTGRIVLHQVENETDLKKGFDVLLNLHSARWGRDDKPMGVFSDKRFLEFHEAYARELMVQKQLRMAWLECDTIPIAIEYQFFDKQTLFAYQAGIDLSKGSKSTGKLTMMASIQFAISNGCQFFDFLSGNDPYKMNWRATPTNCYDLRVWQRTAKGFVTWFKWHIYTQISQRLKRIIPQRYIIQGLELLQTIRKSQQ